MTIGAPLRHHLRVVDVEEDGKLSRLRRAAPPPAPRPARAVSQQRIEPRPITDEVVG